MLLSLNILSELVDISGLTPKEIALKLTMSSAETEEVNYINEHFKTIITAKIVEIKKHPDADKLTLVKLTSGDKEHNVICGAPNHKEGDIVALALEGTRFSQDFVIKKTKIRGVESNGMLCSEKELGLAEEASGILILPEDTPLGIPLTEIYKNANDVTIEIDNKSITHRPDLWGHQGFAREISAIFNRPLKNIINKDITATFKNEAKLNVTIEAKEQSARYCGLVVKNIKIAESPEWLKSRISAIGMRPINNIVDVTNYVMAELGEPMHAFDRKKLKGDDIIVRMARDKEKLQTLDESEYELTTEDIVIADKDNAIALAGVMGGGNSEIEDNTTEIVLEAANFDAVHIRKTAHRYDNRTDAAMRFEKSLDPELCELAIIRCYQLIKEIIPEAEAVTKIVDAYPGKPGKITVNTNTDYIRRSLGQDLTDEKIITILESLSYKIQNNSGKLEIDVPSYRATKDISIAADIVEEVGRIYGYDNITPAAPMVACAPPEKNYKRTYERKIKEILSKDHNMIEVYNYSFLGEDLLNQLRINQDKELRLKNHLSIEHDRLRRSLVPYLIKNIESNIRFNDNFKIYELGRVYKKDERSSKDLIDELTFITGAVYKANFQKPLFYTAKHIVKNLCEQLNLKNIKFEPASENLPAYVHPVRTLMLKIDNKDTGLIFELHPQVVNDFNLKGNAALFDINMEIILNAAQKNIKFKELPKFPDVPFELSVLMDKNDYAKNISDIVQKSNKELIKKVDIISIYKGTPLKEDQKSVSLKVIFGTDKKTLEPAEIENLQKDVITALNKKGYNLR